MRADEYGNVYAMGNAGMTYQILQDWQNSLRYYGAAIDAGHDESDKYRRFIRIMVDDGLVTEAEAAKWL